MEEDYEIIENVVKQILTDFKEKVVIPGDVYDVRAIGPQKYTDYIIMAAQWEAEMNVLLNTLPKIRELSKKLESFQEEIEAAVTDHVDASKKLGPRLTSQEQEEGFIGFGTPTE